MALTRDWAASPIVVVMLRSVAVAAAIALTPAAAPAMLAAAAAVGQALQTIRQPVFMAAPAALIRIMPAAYPPMAARAAPTEAAVVAAADMVMFLQLVEQRQRPAVVVSVAQLPIAVQAQAGPAAQRVHNAVAMAGL